MNDPRQQPCQNGDTRCPPPIHPCHSIGHYELSQVCHHFGPYPGSHCGCQWQKSKQRPEPEGQMRPATCDRLRTTQHDKSAYTKCLDSHQIQSKVNKVMVAYQMSTKTHPSGLNIPIVRGKTCTGWQRTQIHLQYAHCNLAMTQEDQETA
jgi:hypothetical protein